MRETQDLLQIIGHTAILAVDQVKRGDEIRSRDTHEGLDHRHLFLASTAGKDVVIQFGHDRQIGFVAQIKICDDRLPFDADVDGQRNEENYNAAIKTLKPTGEDNKDNRVWWDVAPNDDGVLTEAQCTPPTL